MTAVIPGSDAFPRSADMIRATAPSGGRVFAMGTMELAWALDDLDGRSPNPQVVAFVKAALRDLTRPAHRRDRDGDDHHRRVPAWESSCLFARRGGGRAVTAATSLASCPSAWA